MNDFVVHATLGIAKFMCREPLAQSVRRFTQVEQQI